MEMFDNIVTCCGFMFLALVLCSVVFVIREGIIAKVKEKKELKMSHQMWWEKGYDACKLEIERDFKLVKRNKEQ